MKWKIKRIGCSVIIFSSIFLSLEPHKRLKQWENSIFATNARFMARLIELESLHRSEIAPLIRRLPSHKRIMPNNCFPNYWLRRSQKFCSIKVDRSSSKRIIMLFGEWKEKATARSRKKLFQLLSNQFLSTWEGFDGPHIRFVRISSFSPLVRSARDQRSASRSSSLHPDTQIVAQSTFTTPAL